MRRPRHKNKPMSDLNLIPVMNLFVGLVPFLLLSATFVPLGGMGINVPKAATAADSQQKKKTLSVTFEVLDGAIKVQGYYDDFETPSEEVKGLFAANDLETLKNYLMKVSETQEKIEVSVLKISPNTKYQEAISILNTIRENKKFSNIMLATEVVDS